MKEIAMGESEKVTEYNALHLAHRELQHKSEQLEEELELVRKQARKGRTLHGNLRELLEQSCMLKAVTENQTEEEIVA